MRRENGTWVCKQCGAALTIPPGRRPDVMISAASGRPSIRILSIDKHEIHRCELK